MTVTYGPRTAVNRTNSRSNGASLNGVQYLSAPATSLLGDIEPYIFLARTIVWRACLDCTHDDPQVAAAARSYLLCGAGGEYAELLGVDQPIKSYVEGLPPLRGQSTTLPLAASLLCLAWPRSSTRPQSPYGKSSILD
jgi:hypothetical protein